MNSNLATMSMINNKDHHVLFTDGENFYFSNYGTPNFNKIIDYDSYIYTVLSDSHVAELMVVCKDNRIGLFLIYKSNEDAGEYMYKSTSFPFIYDEIYAANGIWSKNSFYTFLAVHIGKSWGIKLIEVTSNRVVENWVVPLNYHSSKEAISKIQHKAYRNDVHWFNLMNGSPLSHHYIRNVFTPEKITNLKQNQIFVFGSNLQGQHGGGAARYAMDHFGAQWGIGVGRTGQCYAIPTMQGGIETIKPYVDEFIQYASQHCDLEFLVTPIGCGIAGFSAQQMAPLFTDALRYGNIVLPQQFIRIIDPSNFQ